MFWQLQLQGTLLFLMHSALKSNDSSLVTSHSHEGSTRSLSEYLWCSIVFCRTEQRGPLFPKGSSDLKASSTDRCGDRELKPQELEGQPGVQRGGRALCKSENTGGHGGHFPHLPLLLVFNGCSLLGSVVKEIPTKEYI